MRSVAAVVLVLLLAGCKASAEIGEPVEILTRGDEYAWLGDPIRAGWVEFTFKAVHSDRSAFRLRIRDHKGELSELVFVPDQKGEASLRHLLPGTARAGKRVTGEAIAPEKPIVLAFDLSSESPRASVDVAGRPWSEALGLPGRVYDVVAIGVHDARVEAVVKK